MTHIKVTVTANDITPCWGGAGTSPRVELHWNNRADTNAMTATFETTSGTAGQAVVYGDVPTGTTAVVLNPYAFNDEATDPIEFSVTVEVTYEEQGKVRIGDEYFDTLVEAVDAAQSGDTITLLNNVEVKRQLELNKANVTLNLGGFTLTASEDFYSTYANDAHLVNVTADGVKITNGTLKTTDKNKHVLNVYYADDIELSGLTLDHTDAGYNGAPMVVNGSNVTVVGKLTTITGTRSWYAINVDNRDDAPASLTFAQNSIMEFAGVKSEGIRMSHTASDPSVESKVVFEKNVSIIAPEDGFTVIRSFTDDAEIVNPENAGLKDNGNGTYEVAPVQTSNKKISGCIYLNEDYHALIVNGRFIVYPHVDNGSGFCTACKGVIPAQTAE